MKKNIMLLLVFMLSCIVAGYVYFQHFRVEHIDSSDICRIAVFQPATHPALDEVAQGFIDTMQDTAKLQYKFDRYNGNGNKILMQAQAQEILQKKYDLIFTIGVGCSVIIKDLCHKKHDLTPIVFTAVDDPVKLDLQGAYITGVVDQSNYQHQIDLLIQIQPSIKKLLLVYDQSQASGLEKDKNQIRSILYEKGIDFTSIEILHVGEIQQKITSAIQSADVVMVLKDNTVVSGLDSLISLCERYRIPLLASDLNSGVKGAALAYGIYELQSGVQSAHQAKLILEQGKLPSKVPVVAVKNMKMKINCAHALSQGLVIDSQILSITDVEGDTHV